MTVRTGRGRGRRVGNRGFMSRIWELGGLVYDQERSKSEDASGICSSKRACCANMLVVFSERVEEEKGKYQRSCEERTAKNKSY